MVLTSVWNCPALLSHIQRQHFPSNPVETKNWTSGLGTGQNQTVETSTVFGEEGRKREKEKEKEKEKSF